MAKKSDTPRILVCAFSGVKFPYAGRGRPPKYAPEFKSKSSRRVAA